MHPHNPVCLGNIWRDCGGHRKKLSFRLATVLSLSLGLCYQSRYILFEATTSRAWKTPLPLRGEGGESLGPLFSKSLGKDFLPSQLQVNRFCSVSPVSLWPPCFLRENILKTAKALVEDTKLLVSGAASTPDKLAQAAQSSAATITQLAEVVKLGAASLGSNDPETQV